MYYRRTFAWLILAVSLITSRDAWAVDTVETWDIGATDLELFGGFDGLGLDRQEREISGELLVGFGIIERLSAYLAVGISADDALSNGVGGVCLGLFGTPVDTDHFDLDLFLSFGLGGEGLSELWVGPALELNLDLAPDLESFGLFLVVGLPLRGCPLAENDGEAPRQVFAVIDASLGAYLSLAERHQLLFDFGVAFHLNPAEGERTFEVGSAGLGYNVMVHDSIELITEVRLDIPQRGEVLSVGFTVGFIATLPSPRRQGGGGPPQEQVARRGAPSPSE